MIRGVWESERVTLYKLSELIWISWWRACMCVYMCEFVAPLEQLWWAHRAPPLTFPSITSLHLTASNVLHCLCRFKMWHLGFLVGYKDYIEHGTWHWGHFSPLFDAKQTYYVELLKAFLQPGKQPTRKAGQRKWKLQQQRKPDVPFSLIKQVGEVHFHRLKERTL